MLKLNDVLFEFTVKRFKYTKQNAINRAAGFGARKFAPDALLKQYKDCREKCSKLKERIQQYRSRAMAEARRSVR